MTRELKCIVVLLLLALCCNQDSCAQESSYGHNIASAYATYSFDNKAKFASEITSNGSNCVKYLYAEFGSMPADGYWGYAQAFWEQKFWTSPLYFHAEYRTYLSRGYDSTLYFGVAYTAATRNGFIALEPLCRVGQSGEAGVQLSIVGEEKDKRYSVSYFIDVYTMTGELDSVVAYGQCRLFYILTNRFALGCIGEAECLTYSRDAFSYSVSVAMKIDL